MFHFYYCSDSEIWSFGHFNVFSKKRRLSGWWSLWELILGGSTSLSQCELRFWSQAQFLKCWKVSKPLLECKYLWPIMLTSVELTQQLGCSIMSSFLNIVMHWVHPERSLGLWTACLVKLRTVVQKDWETLSVALLVCNNFVIK